MTKLPIAEVSKT